MRVISLVAALAVATALSAPVVAATSPKLSRIASSSSCAEQRKVCYAGKTQTDGNGVRYVPPDAVAECEGAYRACMQHH